MLTPESLEEFKQIYQEEFGILLTNEAALEKALSVFNLVKTLVQPQRHSLINKDSVDGEDEKVQL